MASVGGDLLGRVIVSFLKERDPALTEMLTVERSLPSSYTIVLSPRLADRMFLHCTGTNDSFGVGNVDYALLENAKIFHLGYPPLLPRLMLNDGDELALLYQKAKETGVVTSLDMTLPDAQGAGGRVDWRALLQKTLPHVDIFLPSIEEILFMLRRDDFDRWEGRVLSHLSRSYLESLADGLLNMGVSITGFKLGEMGFYLHTADIVKLPRLPIKPDEWANARIWHPAYEVQVAGTTGAGDSAYAGFLASLLHGMTPQQAAQMACAVGACNVEAIDATSGVRTWTETESRLNTDLRTKALSLPG
jgi:sugar/nucleoside kinase (ribokinase family)